MTATFLRVDLVHGAGAPEAPPGSQPSDLASELFQVLYGNPDDPLVRGGLGIPTRRWELGDPSQGARFPALQRSRALHAATFLFIDDAFVLRPRAGEWVDQLVASSLDNGGQDGTDGVHRILPVALTRNAFNLGDRLSALNHIRFFEVADPAAARRRLRRYALHALCRLLGDAESEGGRPGGTSTQERLFLSHAKRDGESIARAFKAWIEHDEMLNTFFDARDLPAGASFSSELERGIASTSLLAIQTDAYAASPWCRREVLWCKQQGRPVVVVNALSEGEQRSFPYLGNVPVVRWPDETGIEPAVERVLLETARFRYFREKGRHLQRLGWLPGSTCTLSASPPELLHLLPEDLRGGNRLVVYPDPPLGIEELDLLRRAAPGLTLVTPTFAMLPVRKPGEPRSLEGCRIGLSISDNRDLAARGFSKAHLSAAVVELSGHLLAQGATLVYGGFLQPPEAPAAGGPPGPNFTQSLMELVHQHNRLPELAVPRIRNYSAWPHYLQASTAWRAANFKDIEIIEIAPPGTAAALVEGGTVSASSRSDGPEYLYVLSESLRAMRRRMNAEIEARILVGGKLAHYRGFMPGILEEALLALERGIPLYVIGAFGGCAEAVGRALLGESPECLTENFQRASTPWLSALLVYADTCALKAGEPRPVDYEAGVRRLHEVGPAGCRNGLSAAESQRLLESDDLEEVIRLVLLGLTKVRAAT